MHYCSTRGLHDMTIPKTIHERLRDILGNNTSLGMEFMTVLGIAQPELNSFLFRVG